MKKNNHKQLNILIIEPLASDAEKLKNLLTENKIIDPKIVIAQNIQSAVKELKKICFHIILTALSFPDNKLTNVLKFIQKQNESIPVVILNSANDKKRLFQPVLADLKNIILEKEISDLAKIPYLNKGEFDSELLYQTIFYALEKFYREKKLLGLLAKEKEYISFLAHEFKNPLTIINEGLKIFSENILGPINTEQKEMIAMLLKNVVRLHRLADNVLNASKLEIRHDVQTQKSLLNLYTYISEIIDYMTATFLKQGIEFSIETQGNLKDIMLPIDRDRMNEVFFNLIGNAIKILPKENGKIRIKISKPNSNNVQIAVCDNGPGISKKDLAIIFERFKQGKSMKKKDGFGLGLHISRQIIFNHGGKIWVESKKGHGAQFIFTLAVPRPKPKVLVIDSDEDVPNILNQAIQKNAYDFLFAKTGTEGLKLAEEHKPDLILLEIVLSDTDGYTLLAKIKENQNTATIPIIGVSALKINTMQNYFIDIIQKPLNKQKIIATLKNHLGL